MSSPLSTSYAEFEADADVDKFGMDFVLGGVLEVGSKGEVREATMRKTGKSYAVKMVCLKDQRELLAIKHEDTVLGLLTPHPHIVEFHHTYIQTTAAPKTALRTLISLLPPSFQSCFSLSTPSFLTTALITMERAPYGDLNHVIQQKPNQHLDEASVRQIITQVLNGVNHMHDRGVAHCDLKLENILVFSHPQENQGEEWQIKLADFGSSKWIFPGAENGQSIKWSANQQHHGTNVGTPDYLAPEFLLFALGKRESYGHEIDMWAIGVITFQLICGEHPLRMSYVSEVMPGSPQTPPLTPTIQANTVLFSEHQLESSKPIPIPQTPNSLTIKQLPTAHSSQPLSMNSTTTNSTTSLNSNSSSAACLPSRPCGSSGTATHHLERTTQARIMRNSTRRMFRRILRADYTFDSPVWNSVSPEVVDFIKLCLVVDVDARLDAREAMNHPWLANPSPMLQSSPSLFC